MRCPLCDSADVTASGVFALLFEGRRVEYRECQSCRSLACDPMPDAGALARMYGPAYASAGQGDDSIGDPKEPERVLATLRRRAPGLFVDFGCGSGSLLRKARVLGWTPVGVEFHPDVVRSTASDSGCSVLHGIEELRSYPSLPADAIHLGDVIEHLTAPYEVVRDLVRLLAPGGCLMAQGPLEAGPCLFSATLRVARRLRRAHLIEMPPYHVLQATVRGQLALFERVGLETSAYRVSEVAWPAPGRLSADLLRRPKRLGLLALRKVSQALSVVNSNRWGNRYFYVGVARADHGSLLVARSDRAPSGRQVPGNRHRWCSSSQVAQPAVFPALRDLHHRKTHNSLILRCFPLSYPGPGEGFP